MKQIVANAAVIGALNLYARGDFSGQQQPSGSNMHLSDFQMAGSPFDFFDLREVPSHTFRAVPR
jgi:hypothetical protein